MRFLVVGLLLALNGLVIYLGGSSVGFASTLGTLILIGFYLAWSFARDGAWPERRGPDDPDQRASTKETTWFTAPARAHLDEPAR